MPAISVLIPVYNARAFLADAVNSILAQTLRDIEIIALNDASNDGSGEYLDSIKDRRLRVFHCAKQGYGPLLNKGLELAKAKYIARMDADDISMPDRLERQLRLMESDPRVVLCGCQATKIDESGRPAGELSYPTSDTLMKFSLLRNCPVPHPGVTFRRADALAVGGYNVEWVPAEDYDLWWRLSERGRFENCREVLLKYRVHETSVSLTHRPDQRAKARAIAVRHLVAHGLAASAEEAEGYINASVSMSRPDCSADASEWQSFFSVVERFFGKQAKQDEQTAEDIAAIRRRLRWFFLEQSQSSPWFSSARWRAIRAARRIDADAMKPWQVLGRAVKQQWSRRAAGH